MYVLCVCVCMCNRSSWRSECQQAIDEFEETRVATLVGTTKVELYDGNPA